MDEMTAARGLLAATRDVRLSDNPAVDLHERLGLTTVCRGLRTAALFLGLDPRQVAALKDHCINAGLLTVLLQHPPSRRAPEARVVPNEALEQYRKFCQPNAQAEFWTCANREARDRVRTDIDCGALLGYPVCCTVWKQEVSLRIEEIILSAVIRLVGSEPTALARAFESRIQVELPDDLMAPPPNTILTLGRFPFVLHVACPSCLESGGPVPD
jgi:hypothetical protein